MYFKEFYLSASGCVLVVNRCRNGNKSSNFIKYGIFLTKKGKINFLRKRPLPEVGYVNVLCPSACIWIIIKWCNVL